MSNKLALKFYTIVFLIYLLTFTLISLGQNSSNINPVANPASYFSVSGQVLSAGDNKPVANASVFLNNATIGSETDNNGNFQLKNIKPGKYILIVSSVGFESYSQNFVIGNASLSLPSIHLNVKTTVLADVVIKSGSNQYPQWYYDLFYKEFLGSSDNAKDTKIINTEQLDFKYSDNDKILHASSEDYLKITNDALGYELKYQLNDFKWDNNESALRDIHYEGSVFFTEMKGSQNQQKYWAQNRLNVYNASETHFFRSLLNNQLNENGFKVYRLVTYDNPDRPAENIINDKIKLFDAAYHEKFDRRDADSLAYWKHKLKLRKSLRTLFPADKNELISITDQQGIYRFSSNNFPVLVIHNSDHNFPDIKQLNDLANLNYIINKSENTKFSFIEFAEPFALIDNNGGIINPNNLVFSGAWVNERVADLLPVNYEPPAKNNVNEISTSDTAMFSHIAKLNSTTASRPIEKVYLHLDKSYYMPGDTIWGKVYTVAGALHQLSVLSGVAHCELIDEKGIIVDNRILKLNKGIALVDYPLSLAVVPGVYHIRAYTNWMRNDDDAYFFDRPVTIGAPPADVLKNQAISSIITKPQLTDAKPDVQFLPEGGELVYGVQSKVGFKAINAGGYGISAKGVIVDNDGNEIMKFNTTHLGMGVFNLTPLYGKTYKANIICADNSKLTISLPVPHNKGFTMAVILKDSVLVKIETNKSFFKERKKDIFYIVAQSGGRVYYSTKEILQQPVFTANIPKTLFPEGIVKFTLFSQSGEPLNERSVFVDNKQDLVNMSLSATAKQYKPGEEVSISIDTRPKDELPAQGSFSVSVINMSRVPVTENSESTILNSLLLTSDIRGYIEDPNYYFNHVDAKTNADLDVLMLTQAYERYNWKDILNNSPKALAWQPENTISVTGTLKTPGGKPVPGGRIDLLSTQNNFFADTVADANGRFKFSDINLPDSAVIVLKARKQTGGADVFISLDTDIPNVKKYNSDTDSSKVIPEQETKQYFVDYTARLNQSLLGKGKQLQEVKVKGVRTPLKPVLAYSSNLNGPGNADQVIMGNELENCTDLALCLDGKIFGVRVLGGDAYNNRNQARLATKMPGDSKMPQINPAAPLAVIVDGIVISGKNPLYYVNSSDIYSIEILRTGSSSSIYGTQAFSGAIIITMKRGGEKSNTNNKVSSGLITYRFNGFYKANEFYSPKYTVAQNAQNFSDYRSTIYWNPNIITDKQGKASFKYFNAGTKGTYRVVIEGIDINGKIGRQVYYYNVE